MERKTHHMTNDTRNDETGRFAEKYSDADVLDALRQSGGSAGTSDVATALDCPYDSAYSALKRMADDGDVTEQRVGNSLLWTVSDE